MEKGKILSSVVACLLLCACGSNQQTTDVSIAASTDTTQSSQESVRLYTLPVPLQTAEYLSATEVPFNDSLLYNLDGIKAESTVFYDAIELGMSMVDVSYMVAYSEHGRATPYIKRAKDLSDQLNIKDQDLTDLAIRFEENRHQPDSLKAIIHEGFQSGYHFFQTNGREGTGLLVVVGVFIEGMYHLISTEPENFEREALMAYHQKNYVKNISELLERVDDVDGVPDLRAYFSKLSKQMEVIGVINHGVKLEGDVESLNKLPVDEILKELKSVRAKMLAREF